jgi:hypothetical protein
VGVRLIIATKKWCSAVSKGIRWGRPPDPGGRYGTGRHRGRWVAGRIATGRIATGRIATGRIATGRIATGRIATGRIAKGSLIPEDI